MSIKDRYNNYREKKKEKDRIYKEKLKKKRIRKRRKRLYFKIIKKKDYWHPIIFYPLVVISLFIELFRRLLKLLVGLVFVLIGIVIALGFLFLVLAKPTFDLYNDYAHSVVDESTYESFNINESSLIYDNKGNLIANVHETSDTEYLDYEDIPQYVVDAFVAIEDRTFWENSGIDLKGIVRVIYRALKSDGEELHGASTITQQLARNIFLTHSVSLERKGKEMLIAIYLTEKYSKEDIMEFYCNDICFANGIYGIQGAAKAYFGKPVDKLSLKQIVYLCSIPNSPEYYNPYKNFDRALVRSEKILRDMKECGFIDEYDYNSAMLEDIVLQSQTFEFNDYPSSYAIDCAISYLIEQDSNFELRYVFDDMDDYNAYREAYADEYELMRHKLYTGGYKIYTSLDLDLYDKLQEILDNNLSFNKDIDEETGLYKLQGALTCIDNETGKVIAVVGGRKQEEAVTEQIYSLNRAYQSYRQPGSSIKPLIVYAPCLEKGFTADTVVQNINVSAAKEKGVDVQSLSGTPMTLRSAVEYSKNGVAWQLFDKITPQVGLSYITNMKFSKVCPNDYFNASALGGFTYGVTTVEMASGYSTLANHGYYREPTCINYIIDRYGNRIEIEEEKEKVYTVKAADDMVDILKGVITSGTASKIGWYNKTKVEAFAKTGTTNQSKDGWLCGATPYYSIAVWVGFDNPKPLSTLYGASYPAKIWKESMLTVLGDIEEGTFERWLDDKSYKKGVVPITDTGYYSYLPGRDDEEVLSEGYTVGNYREDRVIGESVYVIIDNINSIDLTNPTNKATLDRLYQEGCLTINTIYSRKFTNEMQGKLDAAYNVKLGIVE